MSCTDKYWRYLKDCSLWTYIAGKGFREEVSFDSIRREPRIVTKISRVMGIKKAMVSLDGLE